MLKPKLRWININDKEKEQLCKILDYAAEKGKAENTKQTIMKMFEQNYTKKQILDIFDEISGRQYKKYLKEYKKNRRTT